MVYKVARIGTPVSDEAIASLVLHKLGNMQDELQKKRDELLVASEFCERATTEAALYSAFECLDEAVTNVSNELDRLLGRFDDEEARLDWMEKNAAYNGSR